MVTYFNLSYHQVILLLQQLVCLHLSMELAGKSFSILGLTATPSHCLNNTRPLSTAELPTQTEVSELLSNVVVVLSYAVLGICLWKSSLLPYVFQGLHWCWFYLGLERPDDPQLFPLTNLFLAADSLPVGGAMFQSVQWINSTSSKRVGCTCELSRGIILLIFEFVFWNDSQLYQGVHL